MTRSASLITRRPTALPGLVAVVTLLTAPSAFAQTGAEPTSPPAAAAAMNGNGNGNGEDRDPRGRRRSPDELVALGFSNVSINEVFPFIAEETGKIVIPIDVNLLQTKRITLLNDAPVPRSMALDLVFEAFRLNGVGVIEREDVVIVGNLDTITTNQVPPIIPAEEDIMSRRDRGTLVAKFIQLRKVKASQALEILQEKELPTYAQLSADDNSNQILVYGDIALCQQMQRLIDQLDDTFKLPKTQTFRLAYADALDIQASIEELFSDTGGGSSQAARSRTPQQPRGRSGSAQVQPPTPGDPVGLAIELRTTVNTQQNSVTVVGEPDVVDEVARLIATDWDLPRKPGSNRIYTLKYTDPIKISTVINELLGQSSGGAGAARRPGGQQGGTDISDALAGIYQIQPFADSNQIVVLAKTEESLEFLDGIITELDQPTEIGLPFVVELKHASAFELAEQLNALLAEPGSGATIRAPEEGLSGRSLEQETGSGGDAGSAGTLNFPWQRAGQQGDEQAPESQLIGKIRIVPISRQNALAVLCPRPQTEAVKELITYFDRPGRQVMLSVIIAEVDLTNDLALGLRLSSNSGVLSTANPDNAFGAALSGTGERTGSGGSLFDSTVLDASLNINALIQALDQDSSVRVLQQPVVFTADNQEAFFFDGQEIPFITDTTINAQGNPTDSFDYRSVGVILNARPRITAQREVDIDLRLELSAVVPGQTLFGGAIIDKRETTTNVVVKNGQTIVLSGILRESESRITRKVPLLGDIPLLGELFTSRTNQTVTTELVAFITPLVVDNTGQNDTNFQEGWRQRLEELSRPIEEQMDEAEEDRKSGEDRWDGRFQPSRSIEQPADSGGSGTPIFDPADQGRQGAGTRIDRLSPAAESASPDSVSVPAEPSAPVATAPTAAPNLPEGIPAPLTTDQVAAMGREELLDRMRQLAALRSEMRRQPGRGPLADRLTLDLSLVTRRLAELDAIDGRAGAAG